MLHSALPPAEELTLEPLADIARGGMGMVQLCRATDGRLRGRALAVKRLNPALEEEPEFVNMFLDETWITATIASPHVVKVEAWGRDDAGLFLAVELVEGVSLSRLIKESKEKKEPFAERTVAHIASQVCAGLASAHELRGENGDRLGLVHRDLTPGNLLVSFDGTVKIADFGIAKAEERLTSTRIGMMKGKPAYMAPEQARGGGIDGRADLFALGVVIFELLTGRRPWLGNNDLETLVNVTTKDPPKLIELRNVSPMFVEVVDKCLRKNPNDRFGSAADVKDRIDAWRRERGFEADDLQSLAAFVRRNTPMQQAWFREALGGQLVRGGVTFMDLEARIDKGRKPGASSTSQQGLPAQSRPGSIHANRQLSDDPLASLRQSSRVAQPLATVPLRVDGMQNGPASAHLEEYDDEAKTKFLESRGPAFGGHAGGAPSSSTMPSNIGPLGSTVALTPEEASAMGARIQRESSSNVSVDGRRSLGGFTVVDDRPFPTATTSNPIAPLRRPPKSAARWIVLGVLVLLATCAVIYYFGLRPRPA